MAASSTKIAIRVNNTAPADVQAIAAFVTEEDRVAPAGLRGLVGAEAARSVNRMLASRMARGTPRDVAMDLIEVNPRTRYVFVVGLGPGQKLTRESIRVAGGAIARALRKNRIEKAALALPVSSLVPAEKAAEALVEGFVLAGFAFDEYKGSLAKEKRAETQPNGAMTVTIVAASNTTAIKAGVAAAKIVGEAQNHARMIGSRPANTINPAALVRVARALARKVGLGFKTLDKKKMSALGMGGIVAVGAGSTTPPWLIVLEHKLRGGKRRSKLPRLLVVGKTITFDTGGISIKPADKMGAMIYDKSGGMTVLGLMHAAAKLNLPVELVGILASAENMVGHTAYRPGDIVKMYNGVTVEITNTDAEGRVVLGDALAWGIETYQPDAVVDVATLTGGVIVALGHTMAGFMSNSDELSRELIEAAQDAGEQLWRLPVGDEQREMIQSDRADIVNFAGREASPLQGAAFLTHFVPRRPSVPWAHVDIAGVAETDKELPYYAKGATGWGVRTLVNWARHRGGLA